MNLTPRRMNSLYTENSESHCLKFVNMNYFSFIKKEKFLNFEHYMPRIKQLRHVNQMFPEIQIFQEYTYFENRFI